MSGLASVFPPPPEYYKNYTDDDVKELKQLQDSDAEIPETLTQLLPPPKPDTPRYRGFGSIWNTKEALVPLEDVGVTRLYGELGDNYQGLVAELHKLLKSALVNFVSLVGIMSVNPEQFPEKVEDLRTILINMHHLLNVYRPHQSRESLILLMTEQIAKLREEINGLKSSNLEISDRMTSLVDKLPDLQNIHTEDKSKFKEWQGFDLEADQIFYTKESSRLEGLKEEDEEENDNEEASEMAID